MVKYAVIALFVLLFLVVMCHASASSGSGNYGYVTLPDGTIIKGTITLYEEDTKKGIARTRIEGKTYITPISAVVRITN